MEALRALARQYVSHNYGDARDFALEVITVISLAAVGKGRDQQMLALAEMMLGVRSDGEG